MIIVLLHGMKVRHITNLAANIFLHLDPLQILEYKDIEELLYFRVFELDFDISVLVVESHECIADLVGDFDDGRCDIGVYSQQVH